MELEAFLKLLDQTIKAPRLSGSKVQSLSTESKSLPSSTDTKLVSTFLKLNNSLPFQGQPRISSLYVFDAIARANKGVKGREGLLNKMEGVVESWVGGMVEDGKGGVWTEGKDKTRKIIEIWTKNATFPSSCLDRLSKRLAIAAPKISTTPPPPIMSPALPSLGEADRRRGNGSLVQGTSATPPPPPGSLPPEIQKLLGIQNAPQDNGPGSASPVSVPVAAPSAGIDLASILAGIAKPVSIQTPPTQHTTPTPQAPGPSGSTGVNVGGQTFNLDPAQLAALANLAKVQVPPIPQIPPPLPRVPSLPPPPPPNASGNFPPFPPTNQNQGGPSHYGRPPALSQSQAPLPTIPQYPPGGIHSPYPPPPSGNYGPSPTSGYSRSPPPRRQSRDNINSREDRGHDRRFSEDRRGLPPPPNEYNEYGGGDAGRRDRSRSPGRGSRSWEGRAPSDWAEPMRGGPGPERGDRDRGPRGLDSDRGRGGFSGRGGGGRGRGGRGEIDGRGSHDRPIDNGFAARQPHGLPLPPSLPAPPFHHTSNSHSEAAPMPAGRAGLPPQPGKDEFGRDLPTTSSSQQGNGDGDGEEDMALDNSDDEGPTSTPAFNRPPPASVSQPQPQHQQHQQHQRTPSDFPEAPAYGMDRPKPIHPVARGPSLETFDRSTFNPADPASWAALAAAWQASTGREPDQMELIQFLAGGMDAIGGGGGGGAGNQGMGGGGFRQGF